MVSISMNEQLRSSPRGVDLRDEHGTYWYVSQEDWSFFLFLICDFVAQVTCDHGGSAACSPGEKANNCAAEVRPLATSTSVVPGV